jgi:hypothetical protein
MPSGLGLILVRVFIYILQNIYEMPNRLNGYYIGKIIQQFSNDYNLFFSIYGSAMFNFGTVLIMSIVRTIFPDNEILRLSIGLSTSVGLLFIGNRYIKYIDQVQDTVRYRAIP